MYVKRGGKTKVQRVMKEAAPETIAALGHERLSHRPIIRESMRRVRKLHSAYDNT
jgi:hypothetical protein